MKKQMKGILYTLLALSLLVSAAIGGFRIQEEIKYNGVQIAIHYSNVLDIARQTNRTVEEVLTKYRELGANVLFVRENTVIPAGQGDLANLQAQGKAFLRDGYTLQYMYPEETNIRGQYQYIKTTDKVSYDMIYENLTAKGVGINEVNINDEAFLEVTSSPATLVTMGVGFNYDDLITAADLGYSISPQVKSWTAPTDEAIELVIEQINGIPRLGTIYFSDSEIPGYEHPAMVELIEEKGLGYVEFFSGKQKGFGTLARSASDKGTTFNVTRLHTVTDSEAKKYTQQALLDRYSLGLSERNLRVFLFKMPNTLNIQADELFLEEAITNFAQMVEESKFQLVDVATPLNLRPGNFISTLVVGLGAIIAFVLLVDKIGFTRTGYILGILGFIGYAGLLKLSPSTGIKMMGLFGAIIFPTYGVITIIDTEPGSYKRTLMAFLKLCLISFGGAITIVGTLSRTSYALGIDIFAGVKVAHLMPIILVVAIVYYMRHGLDIEYYRNLLMTNINYLTVAILGAGAVALLVYTSRTGNSGNISEFELAVRQLLDTVLGVRPRTKEFLIGHPIMIALIYFGYQEKYLLFLVLGVIGQLSLVNTYAHLHTPIIISLIRSAYGIIFGILIGMIIIAAIKILGKVINQWVFKKQ